jgi:hypothetical protein
MFATIILSSLLATAHRSQHIEQPIVRSCAIDHGAFCVLDAGMEVREASRSGETQITVHPGHSPEQAATVAFPTVQCRRSLAHSPHLAGYSAYDPRDGRIYMKLIFKLSGTCSLTVSAPSFLDRESSLMGLSIILGLVRLCEERPCSGSRLMDLIPDRLSRSWFSRR